MTNAFTIPEKSSILPDLLLSQQRKKIAVASQTLSKARHFNGISKASDERIRVARLKEQQAATAKVQLNPLPAD